MQPCPITAMPYYMDYGCSDLNQNIVKYPAGKCKARILAFTWTGQMCKRIVYSGCADTQNVFFTKKQCLERE